MEVEGAQSFSGEESRLRIEKSSLRVSNAIVALVRDSALPKFVNITCALIAEVAKHI